METSRPSAWQAFWQSVIRFQADKITPWLALRNTIGIAAPLLIGAASGSVAAGLIVSTGALNVAFRDSEAPYPDRARHMLAASVLAGLAVFAGSVNGRTPVVAVVLASVWAFAAGILIAVSTPAGELGSMSLVMLVVYGAVPMTPHNAALSGLGAFMGGVLQMLLAIASWPLRRYTPERRALGVLYIELSRSALVPPVEGSNAPLATAQSIQAQISLAALDRDRSVESDRFRVLLSQAERIRLSLLALRRVRVRLERDYPSPAACQILDHAFELASSTLSAIGKAIQSAAAVATAEGIQTIVDLAERLRQSAPDASPEDAMIRDARFQLDALAGQLRSAVDLASDAPLETGDKPPRSQPRPAWISRFRETLASVRANLNLESAACRHAIRLSVSIAIGDALGRSFGMQRPYWIPMTIAIVLRPDFSATFSRGVLRLIGTFVGVVLATGLFHVLPRSIYPHILVIAALMFIVRCFGGANYGVFATVITALVVFLISLSGVAPGPVIAARTLNTAIGGAIALLAYWVWPTWERHQVAEAMARMLDAFRAHFRAIRATYADGSPSAASLDRTRSAARLARSNFEASIERAAAEPGVSTDSVTLLGAMLASSHRLAKALLALEAAIANSAPVSPRPPFFQFANDVELTVYYLAAALRGSRVEADSLPDLREDHRVLVQTGDSGAEVYALVNVETDRITNSLNTLSGEILRWVARS